jgi:GTPase SAR1 family protein
MSRWLEHRLQEFVDRSKELTRFRAILDDERAERIVIVWGEEATGKSSLLMRFAAELGQRQLVSAQVDWKGSRNYDFLAFLRSVRDQLRTQCGQHHFAAFTDLVNFFTKPDYNLTLEVKQGGSVGVLNNASISGATIGNVTGVVIEDLKVVMPRQDLAISDGERVLKLTTAFAADLAAVTAERRLVLMLDSVEKIDEATQTWLWEEFLPLLREGQLGDLVLVLCGTQPPPNDAEWIRYILDLQMPPLAIDDIKEYLVRRKAAAEAELNSMAMLVASYTNGKAGSVASMIDGFIKFKANQAGEG